MEKDYDVIVVGAGGAGLCAAIEAADQGASVVVFEAAERPGGSTALSAGVYYAAETSVQKSAGIEDSIERMYDYYMTLNQWNLEPWLVRRFCDEGAPALDWLIGLGVEFPPEMVYVSGVDDIARGHQAKGGGTALFEALYNAAGKRGIEIHCGLRVEALAMEGDRVAGITAQGATMRGGAVVLASGGYGANTEMLKEFYPQSVVDGEPWSFYFGAATNRGDGLIMGCAIGAATAGRDRGLICATPGWSKLPSNMYPSWLVFVNLEGRRFMDETAPYSVSGDLVRLQTHGRCFAILDERARASAETHPGMLSEPGPGDAIDYSWTADRILEQARKGFVHVADTLEELARKTGIHPGGLHGTIKAYNLDAAQGVDRRFFKEGQLRCVTTPPFYAIELRPSSLGNTATGLRVDPDTRVYSENEEPIPGLFAAGEVAGGVLGDRYVGGGNCIANSIIFGRIAGRNAAEFAQIYR